MITEMVLFKIKPEHISGHAEAAGQDIYDRTEKGKFPLIMAAFEKIDFLTN